MYVDQRCLAFAVSNVGNVADLHPGVWILVLANGGVIVAPWIGALEDDHNTFGRKRTKNAIRRYLGSASKHSPLKFNVVLKRCLVQLIKIC